MKQLLMCVLAASLTTATAAQEKFEQGKPNNSNYRYLDEYQALKDYIDYTKYPNFKLGAGTTVNEYLNQTLVKDMINKNFTETVAGNAMKMASCVDGNGNMCMVTPWHGTRNSPKDGCYACWPTSPTPVAVKRCLPLLPARILHLTKAWAGHRTRINMVTP